VLKVTHFLLFLGAGASSWLKNKLSKSVNVFACVSHEFSATALLPVYRTSCINLQQQLIHCWTQPLIDRKVIQFFSTVPLILSQNFYQDFVLICKNYPYFSCHQKRKHYCCKLADLVSTVLEKLAKFFRAYLFGATGIVINTLLNLVYWWTGWSTRQAGSLQNCVHIHTDNDEDQKANKCQIAA